MDVPPELLPSADRAAEIAALRDQIKRRWVRHVVWEDGPVFLVLVAYAVLHVIDVVPERSLVPVLIVLAVISGVLTALTLRKVTPLNRRLQALLALEAGPRAEP